jgi:hypothetical protein
MTAIVLIFAAYLTAGLATAMYWHRRRNRFTRAGQWIGAIALWFMVAPMLYDDWKGYER